MKVAIVNLSQIAKHPTNRMDADYWVGKANGEEAFKKVEGGKLAADDTNGKIMLEPEQVETFNSLQDQSTKIQAEMRSIMETKKRIIK